MVPVWGRQDPAGPHVGPVNFAIWGNNLNPRWSQSMPPNNITLFNEL